MEVDAVDRVSVVDKESGDLLDIAGGLRDALGGPRSAWMLGDAGVDDGSAGEGENDEDVKDAESARDEDEEVAGPGLVQVVADECGPALATLSVEVGRTALLGEELPERLAVPPVRAAPTPGHFEYSVLHSA